MRSISSTTTSRTTRRSSTMGFGTTVTQGLIGGASGAGCMTAVRMAARRLGLIDATPPQATRDWLTRQVGVAPGDAGTRQLLDSVVHLAVGLAGGAVYGALAHRLPHRSPLSSGALFGLGVWTLAFGMVAPRLGIISPGRGSWQETSVNVAAHLVYGIATSLVTAELRRQVDSSTAGPRALRARIG
jgi:uncharacterized membrane protein YagU involved in acid resistance